MDINKQESKINKVQKEMGIEFTENFMKSVSLMKPGQMTHALINVNNQSEYCLLIKEERHYLKSITYNPVFSQGMVNFEIDGVIGVVYLIKANNDEKTLYETWLNYYNNIDGYSDIEMFAKQGSIKIVIVNPIGEVVKIKEENNNYRAQFEETRDSIKNSQQWSMHSYNACKLVVSREFPSITSLWEEHMKTQIVKEAEEKKQKGKIKEAVRTKKKVLIDSWLEPCNNKHEECSLDEVSVYAMPNGSIKTERIYTY